ncbi:MAG TPA: prepilin-type N-terminal cleavage/methylation domain-containing protein, partial [Phycisphaeraceae bacterium]
MSVRTQRHKGFTLVEILIVVVILGILAAIVIPQFTNASESAKASSLVSQLQTIRSQLELAKVQHKGVYPDLASSDGWDLLTKKTDPTDTYDIPTTADGDEVGPYLQQAPKNPFSPDPD